MRYKIYFNKGLKLSPEKLASQVAHVTLNLGVGFGKYYTGEFKALEQTIIVLGLSNKKFNEQLKELATVKGLIYHIQTDLGLTEVVAGTTTCFGYIEM